MTRIDDLAGKAVPITGAGSGIGAAVAHVEKRGGGSIINGGSIAGVDGGGSGAFLFLASNEFSGYITGNMIHVNGGMYMP
jgi:NAD(P)-dependent dehydrogenase (short-subunit alcohol dehydrogenase family)